MQNPHATLLIQASEGKKEAIDSLLQRHLPSLRAFIRLRVSKAIRERESCSDLAQSVCRELLEGLGDYEHRGEAAFRGWLFTAALSKIRDRNRYYKARKRSPAEALPLPGRCYSTILTPSRIAVGHEEMQQLEAAFEELPEDYQEVITLARIAGLSHGEIGERMQRSEAAVTRLLGRALRRLSWIMTRP